MVNFYTTETINRAIEIAEKASHSSALTILSASATVEEVEKMMPTVKLITDLFVNNFKSVLNEGRGGRPSTKKER